MCFTNFQISFKFYQYNHNKPVLFRVLITCDNVMHNIHSIFLKGVVRCWNTFTSYCSKRMKFSEAYDVTELYVYSED